MRPLPLVAGLALLLALPAAANAQVRRTLVNGIEASFGASNVQATTGNGGLTVGVARDGEISVLSWPSPTLHDHVHYMSMNGVDARSLPHMGALDGMGVYAGLLIDLGGDLGPLASWFRDDPWSRTVRFASDEDSVVQTTFENAELGLTVIQTDFVPEEADVLVRRYAVDKAEGSPVYDAWLLGYANLSPNRSAIEELPIVDFGLDQYNDFVAIWDATSEAIVHFHPDSTGVIRTIGALLSPIARDFGAAGELMRTATVDRDAVQALADGLDAAYGPGVFVAMGAVPAPDEYQVGLDATPTCAQIDGLINNLEQLAEDYPDTALPVDSSSLAGLRCGDYDPVDDVVDAEGWQWLPQDALADIDDGWLARSPIAAGQVNTMLRVPLDLPSGDGEAALLFAFDETADGARGVLAETAAADLDAMQQATAAAHADYVDPLFLPDELSPELRRFCQRVFLNLRVGTDRDTAAVVASITRQAPYHLDWPRDGAFFNQALDLAGLSDLVTRRQRFYASVVRDRRTFPTPLIDAPVPGWPDCPSCRDYPPDTFEMNYYADGRTGANIRLEIDNTALVVWSMVAHAGYLDDDERGPYLAEMWPTIEASTNWLAGWRDPDTGLTWPANEDDNADYTQGLQAAATTFAALRAAAMAAAALDHQDQAQEWAHRAGELRSATMEHLYLDGEGFLRFPGEDTRMVAGASAWVSWPARLLEWDDPRLVDQVTYGIERTIPRVRGEGRGTSYTTKAAISAALVLPPGATRDLTLEMAELLAGEIADPDTHYLGEVFLNVDDDGDGATDRRVNAVSTPHLWAGTLVYLTAVAYHAPERFDRYLDVLPHVPIPAVLAPGVEPSDGEDTAADTPDAADGAPDTDRDVLPPGSDDGSASGDAGGCACTSAPAPCAGLLFPVFAAAFLVGRRRR